MVLAATLVAVLALLVSVASAAFTRGQLREARKANLLSEHARSTALDIEQQNMVLYRTEVMGQPGPFQYSGIHPRNFLNGTMEFNPEAMYLEVRLTLLNMGPGNCFRVEVEVSSTSQEVFSSMTSAPILAPGALLALPLELISPKVPVNFVLTVTWRDELGMEQRQHALMGEDGYFVGARTNAF